MAMVFEDAFMDAQANTVSLCMEFLEIAETDVDTVYIYFYISEGMYFFNTFFKKGSKIIKPYSLTDKQGIREFLHYGAEDAQNIQSVCKSYNKACPYEMKLVFETKTNKFDSKYRYEPLGEDESPTFRFLGWCDEIEKSL